MHRDAKPFLVYVKRADGHSSALPTPEPSVPRAVGETRKDLDARTWCAECQDEIVPNDGAICEMCAIALRAALAAQEGTK